MIRPATVETVCFEILLVSLFAALAAWMWGMVRKSFGAIPAMLWLVLSCVSLICAAMIGILEFSRR
jgi:MFS-type transporter involved in bile tolerance (Atg22 family)